MDQAQVASWPLRELAAFGIPLTYALGAASRAGARSGGRRTAAAALAFLLALLISVGALLRIGDAKAGPVALSQRLSEPPSSVLLDVVSVTMLTLVTFIGLLIQRFSRSYLRGEAAEASFSRWLLATLAAVSLLVTANHLLVIALAWMATSLSLHQLLIFYPDRTKALVAAHKKFVVSRLADVCILGAFGIVALQVGTPELAEIQRWAAAAESLPATLEFAAVLLVIGASLKCAQLPFHGWLTQVMEAPTPVSALLHAGVVNIGGYLMIRLSPLMAKAELAQTLLVAIGSATAVASALVMLTRVSVKVSLAWSTCAQMGFMLVQCGLGAYQLALLHLVAHSLYKAHAFLSAGSAVDVWGARALARPLPPTTVPRWFAAAAVALFIVTAVAWLFGASPRTEPPLWALALVLSLALTPLLVRALAGGRGQWLAMTVGGAAVAALYFGWHAAFGQLLPTSASEELLPLRLGIVIVSFTALFLAQAWLCSHPEGTLARRMYPLLFAGLYLDELFTRTVFRLWSPRLPPRATQSHPVHVEILEA